jgi:hypothetical protein
MPLPSKTKRLTLESVGAPELFIEFRRTAGMMYGEFLDIFGEEELPRSDGSDGSEDKPVKTEREITQERFAGLVIDWNIPHDHTVCTKSICDDPSRVLVLPEIEPSVVFEIPKQFSDYISREMMLDHISSQEDFLDSANQNRESSDHSLQNTRVDQDKQQFQGVFSQFITRIGLGRLLGT